MMFRNVAVEIVRRRLWPIPAVALVVAVAAPTLFMKSAPSGAAAAAPAAVAPAGGLPARAERLLAATGEVGSDGGATGSEHDPFQPPAPRHSAAAAAKAAKAAKKASKSSTPAPAAAAAPTEPVPVVIQNPDGSPVTPAAPAADAPAPAAADGTTTTTATAPSTATPAVDVRFGEQIDSPLHRAIPLLQPYFIHGKLAAVFVKYSTSADKAVFAVDPGIAVTGPVKCRQVEGVCRYLDIPAGSYAYLTMSASRTIVRRRLDVVRIDSTPSADTTTAIAAEPGDENACLLDKLLALTLADAPVDRDACGSSK
jgi:hypothetical protein